MATSVSKVVKVGQGELSPVYPVPQLKPGQVLVAEIKDGEETGVFFAVSETTYNRSYTDETKFRLKKKYHK